MRVPPRPAFVHFVQNTHYRCKMPCKPICTNEKVFVCPRLQSECTGCCRPPGATQPLVIVYAAGAADSIAAPGGLSALGRPALICHRRRQTALSADKTATRLTALERTSAALLIAEKRSRRRQASRRFPSVSLRWLHIPLVSGLKVQPIG